MGVHGPAAGAVQLDVDSLPRVSANSERRAAEHDRPAPWTEQGYPFFSGTGVYSREVELPDVGPARVIVDADAGDDVLEVLVNGSPAGVRLWPPYGVEITDLLPEGEWTLGLRVTNTAVNLIGGTSRTSGLRAAPRLVVRRPVQLNIAEAP